MRNCTKEEGPQDPPIKNWVHATPGCRADVLMLMMGRRLAMGKLKNSTRPGPQFCLQCTRWQYAGVCAGLTKHPLPLYHFVHMIVFSEYSTSSLFTTYSSTWKANEPILIFPGNSASAAIKLLSSVGYFCRVENWMEPHFALKTFEEWMGGGVAFMQSKTNQLTATNAGATGQTECVR